MSSYLLEIKKVIDALISVGAPLEDSNHVEAILEELIEEYGPFIILINLKKKPIYVRELEALFMSQEEWIEKFRKLELNNVQVNMAHSHNSRRHNLNGSYDNLRVSDNGNSRGYGRSQNYGFRERRRSGYGRGK